MDSGTSVLFESVLLHRFSGTIHLVVLLALCVSWMWKKIKVNHIESSSDQRFKNERLLWYKPTLFCCGVVSVFNFILCLLSYFCWSSSGWSDQKLLTLSDFVIKTLAWGTMYAYLHTQASKPGVLRLLFWLRIWWCFYLLISCYCLIVDIVRYRKYMLLPIHYVVSDIVSVCTGLFLCYVGILQNMGGAIPLHEPLLAGHSSVTNGEEARKSKQDDIKAPYTKAGFFSLLAFAWLHSLIAMGNKKTLDLEDVPQLDSHDSIIGAFPIFRRNFESVCGGGSRVTTLMLLKAMFFSAWKEILLAALFDVLNALACFVGPSLIGAFVQYLSGRRREFKHEGYIFVAAFFGAKLAECLTRTQNVFTKTKIAVRTRAVLVTMIYNKGLTLSFHSKQCHTNGEIINLMAVDADNINYLIWSMHDPWLVVLKVLLALLILYKNIGLAAIAALFTIVVVMLANFPFWSLLHKFQNKWMEAKDSRMKKMCEILRNIRILKLQGWEVKFLSRIIEVRKIEEGWLKKNFYALAMISFLMWGAPTLVSVVSFGVCMLLEVRLESGKILSALAIFSTLKQHIFQLPHVISNLVQIKVSLDRISSFLCLDDLQSDVVGKIQRDNSDTTIKIVDGTFSWDVSSLTPTLRGINLKVYHGTRVAVCGTVGSGKSSLLSCILGEIPKISGTIHLCGTKAYVAQSPWIQSGKIEDNVLFGKEMDRERYERVLQACSLIKDLEILPLGDQTVIGERGINLSGGQKQRIQIARALYQDVDTYLFDDPFSAVDAHTGSHLFKEVILGLLNSKTVIYVTHQVEFLPAADLILVMKDGQIIQAGRYNDILKSGTDFIKLVGAHMKALSALNSTEQLTSDDEVNITEKDGISRKNEVVHKESKDGQNNTTCTNGTNAGEGQLVQAEAREKGKVAFSVYWNYITMAYGGALVPFILLAQILFQTLEIASNYWMAWATPVSRDDKPVVRDSILLLVYAALSIGVSICYVAKTALLQIAGYKTATLLFNKMHLCIFRAPMSFFDVTPDARILSRASTDQSAVDFVIPLQTGFFAFGVIQLLGIIVLMSLVAWQVCIFCIPVIAICFWYQQYCLPSARELARLAGVCESPVIQHFEETISGSTTIRGFDQESRFRDLNMKLTDEYSRPKFYSSVATEWLGLRVDLLSATAFAFSLIVLISIPEGVIDPRIAGLVVTYGLTLNSLVADVVSSCCDIEETIISVERIFQYTSIDSEPSLVIQGNRPENTWPSYGEVDLVDLQVRYAPHAPLVLRGLTCTFVGGKRTGIVGRTGCGKSTLIQTLFRIIEPTAGQIMIDGLNICSIGLHDLRSRLSIIPQEPTMFEGTIRSNLDPLEEYTDMHIWEALDKCQLGDEVRRNEGKLDSTVSENGENWSMGQKQLVCLGRVLLKKSKILVLDEATASVDTETDNRIQETLRRHFSDCTVITIAHRITSVLDSDMILLLNDGVIEEYDSPAILLENKCSSFAQLVEEFSARSRSKLESDSST